MESGLRLEFLLAVDPSFGGAAYESSEYRRKLLWIVTLANIPYKCTRLCGPAATIPVTSANCVKPVTRALPCAEHTISGEPTVEVGSATFSGPPACCRLARERESAPWQQWENSMGKELPMGVLRAPYNGSINISSGAKPHLSVAPHQQISHG